LSKAGNFGGYGKTVADIEMSVRGKIVSVNSRSHIAQKKKPELFSPGF